MGQFSWISNEGDQIIIQSKNLQTVSMVYLKNGKPITRIEKNYKGYGVFGNMDYFSAVCLTNKLKRDRDTGVMYYYSSREILYPQLFTGKVPDIVDFTIKQATDP